MSMILKPSQAAAALKTLVECRRPVFLWGPPGIGKSRVIRQVASIMGIDIKDERMSDRDPVDLRGVPSVVDGKTHWNPPATFPYEGRGIFLMDEFNTAPASVQTSCLQLVLDRRLGDYRLPDGWAMVLAGNREQDGTTAIRMSTALRNRLVHIEMQVDLDDWQRWAVGAGVDASVVAFLRFRPALLHQHSKTDRSYPTPRSWEFVSDIVKVGHGRGVLGAVEMAMVEGTVGDGAAHEYCAFLEVYRNLPDVERILAGGADVAEVPVPTDPATRYAVTYALARRVSKDAFHVVVSDYVLRMPLEYQALFMHAATTRDDKLATVPVFTEWALDNAEAVAR